MIAVLCAVAAGVGVHLLVVPADPSATPATVDRPRWRQGITVVTTALRRPEHAAASLGGAVAAGALAGVLFGGPGPAALTAGFGAAVPLATRRRRDAARRRAAHLAWPALIEEIRVQTGSLGRSIPQAFFAVAGGAPPELRPAWAAAHREWVLTTDLGRALAVFRRMAPDPSAHLTCKTLLVAHEIGGVDLDRRLAALAEDRRLDVQVRRDAESRLAGARFARRFVVAVPVGMAAAGTSIGTGRRAYATPTGQLVVTLAIVFVIGCWYWAGRIMQLPVSPVPTAEVDP